MLGWTRHAGTPRPAPQRRVGLLWRVLAIFARLNYWRSLTQRTVFHVGYRLGRAMTRTSARRKADSMSLNKPIHSIAIVGSPIDASWAAYYLSRGFACLQPILRRMRKRAFKSS
jgi:hypothetical protein